MITLLNKFDDGYIIKRKDILEVVDHYIKEDGLDGYINDVNFDNNSKYIGGYNIGSKIITLNEEKLLENCHTLFSELSKIYKIGDEYSSYFINFYYLYTLFHEIEHAKQTKDYDLMKKNVLYEFLYELCINLNNSQDFYHENHSLFPLEIDANNNGYLKSFNLLSYTKLPKRETRILYLQYLFSLLYNYQRIDKNYIESPIEKLLQNSDITKLRIIIKLLKENQISKIDRMNYGLFITPKEFDSVNHEKVKILCHRGVLPK